MINPSFKELAQISKSRYDICVMVMKRARLLTDGSEPLVKSTGKKACTVALDEIMQGAVVKKEQDLIQEEDDQDNRLMEEIAEHEVMR